MICCDETKEMFDELAAVCEMASLEEISLAQCWKRCAQIRHRIVKHHEMSHRF
jgi:hypothetical protein